ncbi:hypothetical protein, partial [Eisenbergiella tayi]|uniref:hypothetical protein n=1 Tax=Eisenbergiella tayi TaxID=1432052 RepID=UPI002A82413C
PPCAALSCKDSCKGRHNHAGPLAASFAALVPLRDYPSGSVPCKEPYRTAPRRVDGRDGGQAKAGRGIPGAGRAQKGSEL